MLRISGQELAPRLVVFDKDGTLVAFDTLWQAWFREMLGTLGGDTPLDDCTHEALAGMLGYERGNSGAWDPLGPLTLASTAEVRTVIAAVLYRHRRLPWDRALVAVETAERSARRAIAGRDLVRPIGDVRGLLQRLQRAGCMVALATGDDRASTEETLERLGIAPLLATTVCGDDGVSVKPSPDMALEVCRRLDVAPEQAIMVGDTILDLEMAHRAGYSHAVGVASGALPLELLAAHADLVIADIHGIEVLVEGDAEPAG